MRTLANFTAGLLFTAALPILIVGGACLVIVQAINSDPAWSAK